MSEAYVRMAGHHVAERIRPVPGSPDALRLAAEADDPSSPWTVEAVPGSASLDARPAQAAAKDAWVSWAIACGADPADADAMTKADLITEYGKGDA
jgi:hypothetical protein